MPAYVGMLTEIIFNNPPLEGNLCETNTKLCHMKIFTCERFSPLSSEVKLLDTTALSHNYIYLWRGSLLLTRQL